MVDLIKLHPTATKEILHTAGENQRCCSIETSFTLDVVHWESKTLFSHGYFSMKRLQEYANGGKWEASSNPLDTNTAAAAAGLAAAAAATTTTTTT